MSIPSNAVPESVVASRSSEVALPTNPLYWSIRRELWEYRSVYLAPLAVAGVYLLGFFLYLHKLPSALRAAMAADAMPQRHALVQPFDFAAAAAMGTAFLVGMLYCLDALHAERRDRSILFWKSLPVSDLTTVLAKASIPLLVLPVVSYAITLVLQGIMLLLSTLVLFASGLSPAILWNQLAFFQSSYLLLYHLFTVHVLWYAPIYAYLLLISAWARRTPLLWALLPIGAISVFEMVVFHTAYFVHFIGSRFSGGPEMDASTMGGGFPFHPGVHLTPGHFLMAPGLWIGLLFAAAFLAVAARIRRYRGPE
jgi:ABC-2 type transport system permease protein